MTETRKKKLKEVLQEVRDEYHRWIADAVKAHPNKSYAEIADACGVSEATVYMVARVQGLSRSAPGTADPAGEASK